MPTESQVHYNRQHLESEVRKLVENQQVSLEQEPLEPIDPILNDCKERLTDAYGILARAARRNRELSVAAEWLIDNFYIIQEQIVQLREDMPISYYKKLPRLKEGRYAGFSRIYELVQLLAEMSDNIIDQENAESAIEIFQHEKTLRLGELWAVPIFIRLVLVVRLADKSDEILRVRSLNQLVRSKIDSFISSEVEEPGYLLRRLGDIYNEQKPDRHFLVVLARHLQSSGLLTEIERSWFDYKFREWNTTLEEQLRAEAQETSRLHLSIQNAISSLRDITETDWSGFVERNSVVERILRLDPSGYYPKMDFKTRDRYRKKIEKLSVHSAHSERSVAEKLLLMAEKQEGDGSPPENGNRHHIGYWLEDEGYWQFAETLNYKAPFDERLLHWAGKNHAAYFGLIFLQFIVLLGIPALFTNYLQALPWMIALTLVASLLPALDMAIVSTHRLLTLFVPPRILPKMDFKGIIPDEYRTIVVVPTLFSSQADAQRQLEALEIRALANPNRGLQYAILSDFTDAPEETMPDDPGIIQAARSAVRQLNQKHQCLYGDTFFLLHRTRHWNEKQGAWMGWERKRGKLEEFNRLLIDPDAETTYAFIEGDFMSSISGVPVRYVITLDADTKLPPGSAIDLVRTAAHPLNRPRLDIDESCVEKGYAIFQPRISIPPKSANKTWFARVFSGNVGLDPYTTAVSDIYQDLFGEGIFTGKGLYDVQVFDKVLGGRFPENTILSHDLLESTYLRTALLTDVELFDDYPTTYLSYTKRYHRWIRGDWQILQWLFSKVPSAGEGWDKNPINRLSKWKILDNLRRSLNPVALLIFLLLGWSVLPGPAMVWTAALLGLIAFPIYSSLSTDIFNRPARVAWKLYLKKVRGDLKINTIQTITIFLFLPHQAFVSIDAVARTLWRIVISRRNLLEWTSASQTEKELEMGLYGYFKKMSANLVWLVLLIGAVWWFKPSILFLAVPLGMAWAAAPVVAWGLSRIKTQEMKELTSLELSELRSYARRTWQYFERYMTGEHNWLPPDNYQEDPFIGTVDRTSPTNMGFGLTSLISAHKLGYITLSTMLDRLLNSLESIKLLEKYKGHFYNWYSTKERQVLHPHYISTVDSANLATSLLVVKQFVRNVDMEQWPADRFWSGLHDLIEVLRNLSEEWYDRTESTVTSYRSINDLLDKIANNLPSMLSPDLTDWKKNLHKIYEPAEKLAGLDLTEFRERYTEAELDQINGWLQQPLQQIESQQREIAQFESTLERVGALSGDPSNLQVIDREQELNPFHPWIEKTEKIASICEELVRQMDFSILYNRKRGLFSIGFNVDHAAPDKGTYDLFSSEARMASFLAIAKGEVPPDHWFRLSRRMTSINSNQVLLSWGGTMFEYLMPLLFMYRFDDTLLSNTYDHAVDWQYKYGKSKGYPWGISESGYHMLNLEMQYQYRAFGVPGLGLRRGLAEDYVVAPYASMLALMVSPEEALRNLRRLRRMGALGMNGFYEAVDYTPSHLEPEEDMALVKMYMAHHQGMGLLALVNVLEDNLIQKLFHQDPLVQSCELLLQERVPRGVPIKEPRPIDVELEPGEEQKTEIVVEHAGQDVLYDSTPRTHLLSNGSYTTLITHAGTGFSAHDDTALTRWRADRVQDPYGFFFYIKDLDTGIYWSVGHQPVRKKADRYDSWFHDGKVQTARVDEWIESFMEVCVSPDDDIELRKITLTNYSDRPRRLELTSYAEIVLNSQQADVAHPAFSSLFVQTDYIPEHHAVVAKRRPRTAEEQEQWMVHTIASDDIHQLAEPLQYETGRGNFIGRGRTLRNPAAMDSNASLSGAIGNVVDPIVSMRRIIKLGPGKKRSVTFGLGKADSRKEAITMADRYDNPYATDRVFELATIHGRVELDHIGLNGKQAHYFHKLGGAMLYGEQSLRAPEETLRRNRRTQSALWAFGISGDLPILLYSIESVDRLKTVDQLLKGHAFWRLKQIQVDLVIINDHAPSYVDELQEALHQQIQVSLERQRLNQRGGVFVLKGNDITAQDRILLESIASAVFKGKLPKLDFEQSDPPKTVYNPVNIERNHQAEETNELGTGLQFYNGYGGFNEEGNEYVIDLPRDSESGRLKSPPAPWINVIANPDFGFITSEQGSDYTWSQNSRENRLTTWSNDAVTDPPGEAIYIRDEIQRLFWSPTPGPVAGSRHYRVRHGFGYTVTQSETMNISQKVTKWVVPDDPVKIIKLTLTNTDLIKRHLSLFRYQDLVLGVEREQSARHLVTSIDDESGSVFAQNHYNNEFAGRTAFATFFTEHIATQSHYTADRSYFIGRNRDLGSPGVLSQRKKLESISGAGIDPCAAIQTSLFLESGESTDIYYIMGEAATEEEAKALINRYQHRPVLEDSYKQLVDSWKQKLSRVQIQTPLPELDLLANGWLQYQNISCRIWGRSAFYQSGGAFGFRDQLQDVSSALYLDTELARNQILLHAAHQFPEGDVLHWWHPPTDRGIRSRISDDLLWLSYTTALYVKRTGDEQILNEQVPFISARTLEEGEHEAYLQPEPSNQIASLYEHCCRAIDRSLTKGEHGLPLIGSGDWNDGMNRIGAEGKGESVWLGFFIYKILTDFIPITEKQKDTDRMERYTAYRDELKYHLNAEGWDGQWYRRAYYDDGTPLGSAENKECQIDAIAQAWAVISKAASRDNAEKALESAYQRLVSEYDGIIRLLMPPFDKTDKDPGYIKGYIPGVRENGGQYTHAALWLIRAFAEIGQRDRALRLLRMLTPIQHTATYEKTRRYKVEPYVVAADVYGEPPLIGRGGWSWYTGSAGWMYRVMLESILGLDISDGNLVTIDPYISPDWEQYSIQIKPGKGETSYLVKIINGQKLASGSLSVSVDGNRQQSTANRVLFRMRDDGQQHIVEINVTSHI